MGLLGDERVKNMIDVWCKRLEKKQDVEILRRV